MNTPKKEPHPMHTFTHNYKPTAVYRSLVSSNTISPTTDHEEARYIPNHKSTCKTYDVRHLDKFLSNSNFASSFSPTASVLMPDAVVTEMTPRGLRNSASEQSGLKTLPSPRGQGSFYMRNDSRDSKIQQKEYLLSILKDFGSKGPYADYNTMTLLSNMNTESLDNHFKKNLIVEDKRFDSSKVDFVKSEERGLISPQQRRKELEEAVKHQMEMARWNDKIRGLTKKNRVYKNGFRSGIVGLDSPVNPETILYTEEGQKFQETLKKTEKHAESRKRRLSNKAGTHASVEFFNRKFNESTVKPPVHVVERNVKKTVDLPHVKVWTDTNHRLFGDVNRKTKEERKQYLIGQETRGRAWDIISMRTDLDKNKAL